MKNYAILLLFVTLFACKKDAVKEEEQTKTPATSELLAQQWKKQTFQILEKGYDNTVKNDPSSAVWNFKKGGEFINKECAECPSLYAAANWALTADNKKITVTVSPARKIEYTIVSLSADKLVVQTVDVVGICGPFDTTGEPGWVAPACPTGLVQYELVSIKN